MLSCALLFAGLLIGSLRPAHTQTTPPKGLQIQVAGRQTFSDLLACAINVGSDQGNGAPITVPAGKSMYLEYVSGVHGAGAGEKAQIRLRISCRSMNTRVQRSCLVFPHETELSESGHRMFVFSQPVGVHLQAGDLLEVSLSSPKPVNELLTGEMHITGYLE